MLGNETRLGKVAKQFDLQGRLSNDPELVFWRRVQESWATALHLTSPSSQGELRHRSRFPGINRLRDLEDAAFAATGRTKKADKLRNRGRAAGLWAFAFERVLQANDDKRLRDGNGAKEGVFPRLVALDRIKRLLQDGYAFVTAVLLRLELLTRYRILTKTMVFISTIDSAQSSLRRLTEDITETALLLSSKHVKVKPPRVTLDTAIMDEAACVMETAVPVLLFLGITNLTLVGDHNQLRPFSHIRESQGVKNHSRSLMERAIDAGVKPQFLDTQYRMHPRISEVNHKFWNTF